MDKVRFIEFLMDSGVLAFGDFTTKSGRQSPYFINTGNFKTGHQLSVLGEYYGWCIVDNIGKGLIPDDVNVLFGPAYKGIPLSVSTAISLSLNYGRDLNYCFNRKEDKDHGEGGNLIGHKLRDGDKVLIIEDVITAGTAVRESIPLLKAAANVQVCGLVISVDRMEKGQGSLSAVQEIQRDYGVPTFPIVNIKEIIKMFNDRNREMPGREDIVAAMRDYMSKYCAE